MNPEFPIRVSLVEDNGEFRAALADWLRDAGMLVVSSYGSAEDALAGLPRDDADVILVDIQLPGMNGVECVSQIKSAMPKVDVLMLTVFEDSTAIFDSLKSGASGYILKRVARAEIVEAIREVHAGGAPMSCSVARRVVQYFSRPQLENPVLGQLTERERTVLAKLSEGLVYEEIGFALGITINTVRKHIRGIYEKLQVNSRAEAVHLLLRK
jgi:DNA-binding NarL/FixJ family response regulator